MAPGVKKKRRRRHHRPRSHGDEEAQRFLSSDSDSDVEHWSHAGRKTTKCGKLEKELGILLAICLLIIISMAAVVLVQAISMGKMDDACKSADCVAVAGSMISLMNLSAQPCEDFYEYACGNWATKHIPPPARSKYGVFSFIDDRNVAQLHKILKEPPELYKGKNSSAIHKAYQYFTACMDEGASEDRGATPFLQMIKSLGSWSVTSDATSGTWQESGWNFTKTLIDTNLMELCPFFGVGVSVDDRNSTSHIIQFTQEGLSLSDRNQYIGNHSSKYHDAFIKFFTRVSTLLGVKDTEAASKAGEEIWQLEKQLAEWFLPRSELSNTEKLYHKLTLEQVQELLGPKFELPKLMQGLFGFPISMEQEVVVYMPKFLRNLRKLLTTTDPRILANYMVWHAVHSMVPYGSRQFKEALLIIKKVTKGVASLGPTWERCVARTSEVLRFAIGALYIKDHFSKAMKEEAIYILHSVREALIRNFPTVEWMDKDTRDKAIIKATAMLESIGYPAFIEDPVKLDAFYENVSLTSDDEFANALAMKKFYVIKNINKLHLPVDKKEWHMGPAEVNAYYNAGFNNIVFPAGVLQWPIYDARAPMGVKFGAVGMVMGHEMTHGFDNQGRLFDKDGNLNNWWGNSSVKAFQQRSMCMVDQYSKYRVGESYLSGQQTLPENIADNGGLKMAYHAYRDWVSSNTVLEQILPGLNLTANQQFFLGFAQVWCSYYTPQYAQESLMTDVHSYAKYRVIGTLSNMESFSQAYSCPANSKMNPPKKCTIW